MISCISSLCCRNISISQYLRLPLSEYCTACIDNSLDISRFSVGKLFTNSSLKLPQHLCKLTPLSSSAALKFALRNTSPPYGRCDFLLVMRVEKAHTHSLSDETWDRRWLNKHFKECLQSVIFKSVLNWNSQLGLCTTVFTNLCFGRMPLVSIDSLHE